MYKDPINTTLSCGTIPVLLFMVFLSSARRRGDGSSYLTTSVGSSSVSFRFSTLGRRYRSWLFFLAPFENCIIVAECVTIWTACSKLPRFSNICGSSVRSTPNCLVSKAILEFVAWSSISLVSNYPALASISHHHHTHTLVLMEEGK